MAAVEQQEKNGWLHLLIGLVGGCLILVILAVIAGYVALSKTGLVGSEKSFDVPEPVRVVEVDSTFDEIQSTLVKSALSSLSNGEVSLLLTDEMLTVLMRDGLAQAGEEAFDVERAQIAVVEDGHLELFIPLAINDRETALRAEIGLALTDGRVKASVGEVRVGNLKLPGNFATSASETAIQSALDSQLDDVQGALQLTGIEYTDGSLRLTGDVDFNPLQFLQ